MLNFLRNLFGCSHHHITFPITIKAAQLSTLKKQNVASPYVVCLDCGGEFYYDWKRMKIAGRKEPLLPVRKHA